MSKKTLSLLAGLLATAALLVVVAESTWLRIVLAVFVAIELVAAGLSWAGDRRGSA